MLPTAYIGLRVLRMLQATSWGNPKDALLLSAALLPAALLPAAHILIRTLHCCFDIVCATKTRRTACAPCRTRRRRQVESTLSRAAMRALGTVAGGSVALGVLLHGGLRASAVGVLAITCALGFLVRTVGLVRLGTCMLGRSEAVQGCAWSACVYGTGKWCRIP